MVSWTKCGILKFSNAHVLVALFTGRKRIVNVSLAQTNIAEGVRNSSAIWVAAGYWSVDAKADTAMNGVWKKGPGTDIFKALEKVRTHHNS